MQYQGEEFEGALAGVLLYDGEGGAWDLNFSSSAHSSIRLQTWNNFLYYKVFDHKETARL